MMWMMSQSMMVLLSMIITTAYLTLMERKILGSTQMRKGPNVVSIYGLLQPIADALKLMMKEMILPQKMNMTIFMLTTMMSMSVAFTAWAMIPMHHKTPNSDMNTGMMFIFALSSLSMYSMLLSGWASNSKYSLLGSMRATAQMMSYEVAMGMMMLTTMYISSSLNLNLLMLSQQFSWYMIPLFPAFIMFLMSSMAETNRTPFDLTESESELVSGFNTEYSAMFFTLLFLAEYMNMMLMATMMTMLFLGGNTMLESTHTMIFSMKMFSIIYMFMWIRATYPRMRYDQLMNLLWKSYLPLSLTLTMLMPSMLLMFIMQM